MTRVRVACALLGGGFGFLLSWAQMTSPETIGAMLLLDDAYLFLMMASAVAVGFVGVRLARRVLGRAVLTGEPIAWEQQEVEPRHVWGAAVFGLGWAVTLSCPGPLTAQLGQGSAWSLAIAAGVVGGILLALRRQRRQAAVPAAPTAASSRPASPLLAHSAPE